MKTIDTAKIKELIAERDIVRDKARYYANEYNKDYNTASEPFYENQEQWEDYLQRVSEAVSRRNCFNQSHKEAVKRHDSLTQEIRNLIPTKAVWFRLPDSFWWVAKTSSSLIDPEGLNLHIYAAETPADLPKLTTL
jgi:argininosuccinate lyase